MPSSAPLGPDRRVLRHSIAAGIYERSAARHTAAAAAHEASGDDLSAARLREEAASALEIASEHRRLAMSIQDRSALAEREDELEVNKVEGHVAATAEPHGRVGRNVQHRALCRRPRGG